MTEGPPISNSESQVSSGHLNGTLNFKCLWVQMPQWVCSYAGMGGIVQVPLTTLDPPTFVDLGTEILLGEVTSGAASVLTGTMVP